MRRRGKSVAELSVALLTLKPFDLELAGLPPVLGRHSIPLPVVVLVVRLHRRNALSSIQVVHESWILNRDFSNNKIKETNRVCIHLHVRKKKKPYMSA